MDITNPESAFRFRKQPSILYIVGIAVAFTSLNFVIFCVGYTWLALGYILVLPLAVTAATGYMAYVAFPNGSAQAEPEATHQSDMGELVCKAENIGGQVGRIRGTKPFFTWHLYSEGILVGIRWAGHGFVKNSAITKIELTVTGKVRIEHSSENVASPLVIPNEDFANHLERISLSSPSKEKTQFAACARARPPKQP
jgi:hypothetical protein